MDVRSSDGWIEVICGSMFAGKTEELIRRITRIKLAKRDVLVFKPVIDDRYSVSEVVSHSQRKVKSIAVNDSSEIMAHIEKLPYAVAIDEAQFFDKNIVNVAGLDLDFRGEPFGVMPEFLARAEYITKLQAICQICGEPATRTQRIIDGQPAFYDEEIVLVSAQEKYEARCRKCHQVPHRTK